MCKNNMENKDIMSSPVKIGLLKRIGSGCKKRVNEVIRFSLQHLRTCQSTITKSVYGYVAC